MSRRKQQLLKKHRQQKRIVLLIVLLAIIASGFWHWYLVPAFLFIFWLVHEAWLSDHLFYSPKQDYQYQFPAETKRWSLTLKHGCLQLNAEQQQQLADYPIIFLQVNLTASVLGAAFDPYVRFTDDKQTFERNSKGLRYLNLTGCNALLEQGKLQLQGHFCRLAPQVELIAFARPDFTQQRIMIIAPHADDAELAAFGLYSQSKNISVVTITQGEIEAENYQALGLSQAQATQLKGRLRSWDSIMVPQWGGVKKENCVQLGYYCLQLPAMQKAPETPMGSRESEQIDVRNMRQYNAISLASDANGQPTWRNLVQDLQQLLEHFQPDIVVTPHPELDPHADHIASTQALQEAIQQAGHKPHSLLLYANHLHDNDRWPMGEAGTGIALPPAMLELPSEQLWVQQLDAAQQIDKALALAMQHDLQPAMPYKKRLRRTLQHYLLGRRWPKTGGNEFFRKAVRRHELFWLRPIK